MKFIVLFLLPFLIFGIEQNERPPMTSSQQFNLPLSMLYRAHPWHGPSLGGQAPEFVNCYIEIASMSTLKFEIDKETGILKVDRPQKYSSVCPCLYGFLPRTYAGNRIAEYTRQKVNDKSIVAAGDPIDVCILSENIFIHGDMLVKARPIGGFRLIDKNQADDKIIAVLDGDLAFGTFKDIGDCPERMIEQLRHYFLTYKDFPEQGKTSKVKIAEVYGKSEAHEVIRRGYQDYLDYIGQYTNRAD